MVTNRSSQIPTRSDTNQPVQSQEKAKNLKFWIYKEEGLYYPCIENKGADQLCIYFKADLPDRFPIGENLFFS